MKNLVETAIEAGNFKTLVKAVQEAGLVDTLQGEGPFTVFAPNDDAFAKLPPGTIEDLLNNKEKLTEILTYHVIPSKVMSNNVVNLTSAPTANGKQLSIDTTSGVKIDNANVVQTDIECSNGVIHVIDTVLIPE
jgi:uncharacterized surface protein with fasciclin (FAS1) repeats